MMMMMAEFWNGKKRAYLSPFRNRDGLGPLMILSRVKRRVDWGLVTYVSE